MAFIQCDFFSEALRTGASINVILPQKYPPVRDCKYPVLYLLHGISDDRTIWMRRTSIERYLDGKNLIVVMPEAGRSFYEDFAGAENGYKFFTYVSEELPAIVKSFFPVSDRREDTFVAGLSMGGYGAYKLALNFPERYAAAASLSSAVDPVVCLELGIWGEPELNIVYGSKESVKGSRNDLFHLAEMVAAADGPKPKLFQCCGTEDILYGANIRLRDHIRNLPLELTYEEESGSHNWGYWDMKIQSVLNWLPI